MLVFDGVVVEVLGELCCDCWMCVIGDMLVFVVGDVDIWFEVFDLQFCVIDVGIVCILLEIVNYLAVYEIEVLFVDQIGVVWMMIYMESQYFVLCKVVEVIVYCFDEFDGLEIVIVNLDIVQGWLELVVMDLVWVCLMQVLFYYDKGGWFRMYYFVMMVGILIYVYVKMMFIDDCQLWIGLVNLNNWLMWFDFECDVIVDVGEGVDMILMMVIVVFCDDFLVEYLDVLVDEVMCMIVVIGLFIVVIEQLCGVGCILVLYEVFNLLDVEVWLVDYEVFDFEGLDEMFEVFSMCGLFWWLCKLKSQVGIFSLFVWVC